jgi:hypothetical protein
MCITGRNATRWSRCAAFWIRTAAPEPVDGGSLSDEVSWAVAQLLAPAIQEINDRLQTRYRFNSVVDAGEPKFLEVPVGS